MATEHLEFAKRWPNGKTKTFSQERPYERPLKLGTPVPQHEDNKRKMRRPSYKR
jgi:hypothetical protein